MISLNKTKHDSFTPEKSRELIRELMNDEQPLFRNNIFTSEHHIMIHIGGQSGYLPRIAFTLFLISCNFSCRHNDQANGWRSEIKCLSDPGAQKINFQERRQTTVSEQAHIQKPATEPGTRHASEAVVYSVPCRIAGFMREGNDDILLLVTDMRTSDTMTAVLVNPENPEVKKTGRYHLFKNVYDNFLSKYKPEYYFQNVRDPAPVKITGIGFWNFLHNERGMAKNKRELHPVLSIEAAARTNPEEYNFSQSDSVRVGCLCKDATRSAATGAGACSRHGGVERWMQEKKPHRQKIK